MCTDQNNTSYTLLERALKLDDHQAWETLYSRYMTFVYHILRKVGVNDSDLDDICQAVFIELADKIKNYDKSKGKFRSWLSTFIKFTALRQIRKKQTYEKYVDQSGQDAAILDSLENNAIEDIIDKEWENYVISIATERIMATHHGQAIEVFKLWIGGKDTAEIAELTGLKVNSVYTLRQRIKKTLAAEADSIREELEI